MARLKYAFHMRFADIIPFREAIAKTPFKNFDGWEYIARGNRISTEGVIFWLWMIWCYQKEEIGRHNFFYVEWRFRGRKLPWPFGTHRIPVGVLGHAKLNWSTPGLNYENATT